MSKVALLIGINYRGTPNELNGCINDVEHAKEYLLTKGYLEQDIITLTDDTEVKPTRKNIMSMLLEVILSDAKYIYFHYSGHGTYVKDDRNGDETDNQDECLCPIDGTLIVDDEIRGLLHSLRDDQSMFSILDCCHSGTGMDLCYGLYERYTDKKLMMVKDVRSVGDTKGQVVMISGCLDAQTSSDAFIVDKYQGALTAAFLQVMKSNIRITYEDLVVNIREILSQGQFTQIPFLTSGQTLRLYQSVDI